MIEIPVLIPHDGGVVYAIVDDVDAALGDVVWRLDGGGYAHRMIGTKGDQQRLLMHRVILGLGRGDVRYGDHINRNKLDNRRVNLRAVSRAESGQNVGGRPYASSRYRGVTWNKRDMKWQASVRANGRLYGAGHHHDEFEAALAAQALRKTLLPFSVEPELERVGWQ